MAIGQWACQLGETLGVLSLLSAEKLDLRSLLPEDEKNHIKVSYSSCTFFCTLSDALQKAVRESVIEPSITYLMLVCI